MTKQIAVPFIELLNIAHAEPLNPLTPAAAKILAQLCGVESIDEIDQPPALEEVRKSLNAQFPWLAKVGEQLLDIYINHCGACPVDHSDKEEFKRHCKIRHHIDGFKKLFGDPVMVEPLQL